MPGELRCRNFRVGLRRVSPPLSLKEELALLALMVGCNDLGGNPRSLAGNGKTQTGRDAPVGFFMPKHDNALGTQVNSGVACAFRRVVLLADSQDDLTINQPVLDVTEEI